ncbi:hypothetical protein Peur_058656 [Populus x canadensis]
MERFILFQQKCLILSKGKKEARTVKKAAPAYVTSKENVKGKGSVVTRLSPVVDTLVDAPPAAAPPVEDSPTAPPTVDGPELAAPSTPSESCVAQNVQPRPQVTNAGLEEWQTVRNRRHNSGNKRQTSMLLPGEGNPPTQQHVSSKGKAPALSVEIAGNKDPHRPGSGVLTRSLVQRTSHRRSGSGGIPPIPPQPC